MNLHYFEKDVESFILNNLSLFLNKSARLLEEPGDVVLISSQLKLPDAGVCDILAADRSPHGVAGQAVGRLYLIEVKRDQVDERAICQTIRYAAGLREYVSALRFSPEGYTAADFLGLVHGIKSVPDTIPDWVKNPHVSVSYQFILAGSGISNPAKATLDALNRIGFDAEHDTLYGFCEIKPKVSWGFAGDCDSPPEQDNGR